jgi:predicted dehydrogenase
MNHNIINLGIPAESELRGIGITTLASSYKDAIAAADLVYLACAPIPRKAYALDAATLDKAIFLEKPLGIDIDESQDLVRQLSSSKITVAVNFTQAAGAALTDVSASVNAGSLGQLLGIDIIVNYANWPRTWQKAADWLRFRDEGGMTREVISHFLFLSDRILGPLELVWAHSEYPEKDNLSETHVAARLINAAGLPVTIMGSVGGIQPDRQEVTIKGSKTSRRISDFYRDTISSGDNFTLYKAEPDDPRAISLKAQLDDLVLLMAGHPNRLATAQEALRIQVLVERILENGLRH